MSRAPAARRPRRTGLVLLLALATLVAAPGAWAADAGAVVLLFDGWSADMVDTNETPTLDRMRREGAWTHDMEPVFPSVSLVNQVSISTGCWPGRHGIVGNVFVDPDRGRYDHSPDADWLLACEHLHEAAERRGVRAAAYGWVGRVSSARGPLATWVSEETSFRDYPDDERRKDQVLELLRRPAAERPELVLAYFRGPDNAAHFTGIASDETRAAVRRSDAVVGEVLAALEAMPEGERWILVVVTDHGMLPVSTVVNVAKILSNHGVEAKFESAGTISMLYFEDAAQKARAFEALSRYEEFDVVRREAQPEGWTLGASARVGDLVLSARPPYFIEDIRLWPFWARWLGPWGPEFLWAGLTLKASHGYPPETPGMQSIFYAWGAGVARGREVKGLRSIDVHPTVTELLGILPGSPVDGAVSLDVLARATNP